MAVSQYSASRAHYVKSVRNCTRDEGKRILFVQEIHGLLDSSLLSNHKDYQSFLSFVLKLSADILCEGHFGIYQAKKEIEQFIRSYLNN